MGELNGGDGNSTAGDKAAVGPFGEKVRNYYLKRVLRFCNINHLTINYL